MLTNKTKRTKYAVVVDTRNSVKTTHFIPWGGLHSNKKDACEILSSLAFSGAVVPVPPGNQIDKVAITDIG